MRRSVRLASLLGSALSLTLGVVACVSDQGAVTGGGDDTAGNDGGGGADATISDGSVSGGDGSTTSDGSASDAGPCAGEIGCPAGVEGAHLQLWLRADKGLDCPAFRVTTWHDQSGHNRHATVPVEDDGGVALGPQCGTAAAKINAIGAVAFTDPDPAVVTASETLQVDLGFLKNHDFTIAIVHQQAAYNFATGLLAFAHPTPYGSFDCITTPLGPINNGALALQITHNLDGGNQQYNPGFGCYGDYAGTSTMTPELLEYAFDAATGHHMFLNTVEIPLTTTVGDAAAANAIGVTQDGGESSLIGRLPPVTFAPLNYRYKGNIAEIVAYDSKLSAADRFVVETYLKTKWGLPF